MSASRQVTDDFASGSVKPSGTNAFVTVSNSRMTLASAPPRESETRQRRKSGGRQSAPLKSHGMFSALARASMSMTVSQAGAAVR